jgi:hypothetical protein
LDKAGSQLAKILDAENAIDRGRKLLDTAGLEGKGRIDYRYGLALALEVFQEVYSEVDKDIRQLMLVEIAFIRQELQLCSAAETDTKNSLQHSIDDFKDAINALDVVESGTPYQSVDKATSHRETCRVKGMPKDAFHMACSSHVTRLGNILRSPGINLAEKELLRQRKANIAVAQTIYLKKQQSVLATPTTA